MSREKEGLQIENTPEFRKRACNIAQRFSQSTWNNAKQYVNKFGTGFGGSFGVEFNRTSVASVDDVIGIMNDMKSGFTVDKIVQGNNRVGEGHNQIDHTDAGEAKHKQFIHEFEDGE